MDVVAHYEYGFEEEYDPEDEDEEVLIDVDIPDLDIDESFLQLVTAKSLLAIARSKRAFTATDFPVTMDGSELASEANTLLDDVKQSLSDKGVWYAAIGN